MMKNFMRDDWLSIGIILLISVLTVFDLFFATGQSANMDGIVHIMTPNLFAHSLLQGNFPVSWIDNFANYGLPLGIISQQLSTYLTAFLILILHNPVLAFNSTLLIGVLFSNFFYYIFLRIYFNPFYAVIGVLLFTFAPYRVLNIYIRGAMPEFFASVFMPLLLLGAYLLIEKRKISGLFLLIASTTAVVLTHPFMLIVSSFFLFPYIFFLLYKNSEGPIKDSVYRNIKTFIFVLIGIVTGVGIAGYYFFPLNREIKYFYYGLHPNHLTAGNYLSFLNFFGKEWYYFTPGDVFARGFFISVGSIETISTILAGIYLCWKWRKKEGRELTIFEYSLGVSLFFIFFTTQFADPIYTHIHLLSNIQFPWRMLSGFILIQPLLVTFMLQSIKKPWLGILLILLLLLTRFPQLYGKNYTLYQPSHYSFTNYNLHATVMNPIWSGRSEDYLIKTEKQSILEGKGIIEPVQVTDTRHSYKETAQTPLHVIDYTFYFPGWNLYIDDQKTPIQYQDPTYRGVITYQVPVGTHTVSLRFEDTTVRKLGKLITVMSYIFVFALFGFRKRIQTILGM